MQTMRTAGRAPAPMSSREYARWRYHHDAEFRARVKRSYMRCKQRYKAQRRAEQAWRTRLARASVAALREAGWSHRRIGRAAGVSKTTIQQWAAGTSEPRPTRTAGILRLRRLALALETGVGKGRGDGRLH